MRKLSVLALFFSFFILFPPVIYAQLTIGVSPPFLDLGEIEPGMSKIARFHVVTSSDDVVLVRLRSSTGDWSIFKRDGYEDLIYNYSEEDITSWVEFIGNPVRLKKSEDQPRTKGGSTIKAANEVTFIVKVPKNAEPGYHAGLIFLDPIAGDYQRMITIKTVVPLAFIFKVPGVAVREGKILEISSGNYYNDKLNLEIFFQNTGTVTIKPKPAIVKILDEDNRTINVLRSTVDYVEPGKTKKFVTSWSLKDVEEKRYNAAAEIDYMTGRAFKESLVEVYRPLVPISKVVEREFILPWWTFLVLILTMMMGYLIYRLNK